MGIKAALSKAYAYFISRRVLRIRENAVRFQDQVFKDLLHVAASTAFGKDHHFDEIKTYDDFKASVPLRDYEKLKSYMERVKAGESDVLWPGKPIYLSKTSGTTSGIKYIPITKESIPNHIDSARNALLMYVYETGKSEFVDGHMMFLSGSPALQESRGMNIGRLSGIVNHHIPGYLKRNQVPSFETNSIEDWESKIDAIIQETLHSPLSLISGIPPWVQMFFDRLEAKTGKSVQTIFPNLSVYVYGGVNYEPYRVHLEHTMGKNVDTIETYPASEGFIAYQDSRSHHGLLLVVDSGIFYEFVPTEEIDSDTPVRLSLAEVELNKNYAIILNTNAGLWGYVIGDTVRFVSKNPYRLIVTGRVNHFISAFGEHVIGEEVDYALQSVAERGGIGVTEFTVAPQVNAGEKSELPYHEWFIEFSNPPEDLEAFRLEVDMALQNRNGYYKDLIQGNILQPLKIRKMKKDAFIRYMHAEGKLGGQNKVPRLSNNREIADKLQPFTEAETKFS